MCACGLRVVPRALASSYVNTIPIQEVINNKTRAKFKTFFCKSPKKVNEALSVVKNGDRPIVMTSMADMEALADYHDNGHDLQYYNQNFDALLSQIDFSNEEHNKKECVVYTY